MLIDEYQATINACRFCPMCRHVCTAATATRNEANTPRAKGLTLMAMQKGLLDYNDPRTVQAMYECATCRRCREWCLNRFDIAEAMLAARADLVAEGHAPATALSVRSKILAENNPYGEPSALRLARVPAARSARQGRVLYFLGCNVAYRRHEMAEAVLRVLAAAEVDVTVLADEPCCGAPLYLLGFRDDALALARSNVQRLQREGYETIVFSCPNCTRMLRKMYPQWGLTLEGVRLLHTTEYLDELTGEGRVPLNGGAPVSVTYLDPCMLGRELGVYDAPRRVLGRLRDVTLKELRHNRELGPCCGNGGGMHLMAPPIAHEAGHRTGNEVLKTGAQILVTACANCKTSMVKHTPGMEVLDIAEMVSRWVG